MVKTRRVLTKTLRKELSWRSELFDLVEEIFFIYFICNSVESWMNEMQDEYKWVLNNLSTYVRSESLIIFSCKSKRLNIPHLITRGWLDNFCLICTFRSNLNATTKEIFFFFQITQFYVDRLKSARLPTDANFPKKLLLFLLFRHWKFHVLPCNLLRIGKIILFCKNLPEEKLQTEEIFSRTRPRKQQTSSFLRLTKLNIKYSAPLLTP